MWERITLAIEINALEEKIIKSIQEQKNNRITFYDFMKTTLYEPNLGYYTKDRTKIGKAADFYTSSSVGPVFGKTIANTFVELLSYISDHHYTILEIGGGDGRFARDVLNGIKEKNKSFYEKTTYFMIETSPFHQKIQEEQVKDHFDHMKWVDCLEDIPQPFEGVIFSNELVDAFPVHMVQMKNGELQEVFVTWDEEQQKFIEILDHVTDLSIDQYFKKQNIELKEEQIAEVNIDAIEWLQSISRFLHKGYLITIDYGYPAEELYASHRQNGSLMCYHKHLANDNPYQNIGDQDITTHVNFSALMDKGEELKLETILFTVQSEFLLNSGILHFLQEVRPMEMLDKDLFQDEALKINRAIRQLITPGEMGETFKVLIQKKNVPNHQFRFMTSVLQQFGI